MNKIVISKLLKQQIDYFHTKIKNTEWSGILLFDVVKGNFKKLEDIEIYAKSMHLMNIGNSTYTEFTVDADLIKAYNNINDHELKSLNGFIHTHHTMNAFFSGTDLKELEDNADKYNFFVSLVVNMEGEYVCKIAIPTKTITKKTIIFKDHQENIVKRNTEEESTEILYIDLKPVFEEEVSVPKWVEENYLEVKNKKTENFQNTYFKNNDYYVSNHTERTSNSKDYLPSSNPNKIYKWPNIPNSYTPDPYKSTLYRSDSYSKTDKETCMNSSNGEYTKCLLWVKAILNADDNADLKELEKRNVGDILKDLIKSTSKDLEMYEMYVDLLEPIIEQNYEEIFLDDPTFLKYPTRADIAIKIINNIPGIDLNHYLVELIIDTLKIGGN